MSERYYVHPNEFDDFSVIDRKQGCRAIGHFFAWADAVCAAEALNRRDRHGRQAEVREKIEKRRPT